MLLYVGDLTTPVAEEAVVDLFRNRACQPNLFFVLATLGGSGESAFRIARFLQRRYPAERGKITLFLHSLCKSSGTLLALAADELVMTDTGELGPLDVQLARPDEFRNPMSGQAPINALETLSQRTLDCFVTLMLGIQRESGFAITTRTAANLASRMTTGLFAPVYRQIEPLRLGEIQRELLVAQQ